MPAGLPKHDPILAKEVVGLLNSATMAKVHFCYKVHVSAGQFRRVAAKITDGSLIVGYEPGRSLSAYDPQTNCFKLANQNLCNFKVLGNVVHEATHAICDLHKMKMLTADAEIIAYVAQAMWLRENSPLHKGNEWGDDDTGKLAAAAFAIADKLLDGKTKSAFNHAHLVAIRSALTPIYDGLDAEKKYTTFDGI